MVLQTIKSVKGETMKTKRRYFTIDGCAGYPCATYESDGRIYIDFHATDKDGRPLPIHSNATTTGAKEAIKNHYE